MTTVTHKAMTPIDSGPDPEEAYRRFDNIRKLYQEATSPIFRKDYQKCAETREAVAKSFVELKLVPRLVDRLTAIYVGWWNGFATRSVRSWLCA